jgi:hypothetical protein
LRTGNPVYLISNRGARQVWQVSRGYLLLLGTWSYLCICRRYVLPYTRFCNCLLDYSYVLHIVNFAILYLMFTFPIVLHNLSLSLFIFRITMFTRFCKGPIHHNYLLCWMKDKWSIAFKNIFVFILFSKCNIWVYVFFFLLICKLYNISRVKGNFSSGGKGYSLSCLGYFSAFDAFKLFTISIHENCFKYDLLSLATLQPHLLLFYFNNVLVRLTLC